MSDYVIKDGKLVPNPILKVKKFKRMYPRLFTSNIDSLKLKEVREELSSIATPYSNVMVCHSEEIMNYVIINLILKMDSYEDVLIMNGYELLDIYLGNNEDVKSIFDVTAKVICLYLGYSEFENKRQSDIIEQLCEQQRVRGNYVWLIYKGRNVDEKYPRLKDMFNKRVNIFKSKKIQNQTEDEDF